MAISSSKLDVATLGLLFLLVLQLSQAAEVPVLVLASEFGGCSDENKKKKKKHSRRIQLGEPARKCCVRCISTIEGSNSAKTNAMRAITNADRKRILGPLADMFATYNKKKADRLKAVKGMGAQGHSHFFEGKKFAPSNTNNS